MLVGFIFFIVVSFLIMYFAISFSKWVGEIIFGKDDKPNYTDKTTHIHHHYHDNRSIHFDDEEFKNLKDKKKF